MRSLSQRGGTRFQVFEAAILRSSVSLQHAGYPSSHSDFHRIGTRRARVTWPFGGRRRGSEWAEAVTVTPTLGSAPVAFLTAGQGTDGPEFTHAWQAVLARGGQPVLVARAPREIDLMSTFGRA